MKDYDPEWATSVLEDLRAFFDANGMHTSADAVVEALRVVRRESDAVRRFKADGQTGSWPVH